MDGHSAISPFLGGYCFNLKAMIIIIQHGAFLQKNTIQDTQPDVKPPHEMLGLFNNSYRSLVTYHFCWSLLMHVGLF